MKHQTVDALGIAQDISPQESRVQWVLERCPECGDRMFDDGDTRWCRSALYMEGPCSPIRLQDGNAATGRSDR